MRRIRTTSVFHVLLPFVASFGTCSSAVMAAPVGGHHGVPAIGRTVADLIPPGWRAGLVATGDLNKDGRPDLALALFSKRETQESKTWDSPRLLVVAMRGKDGLLHRSLVTPRAILTHGDGGVFGDPLEEIKITRGSLLIHHYGGSRDRWDIQDRYRPHGRRWDHIGKTDTYSDTLDPTYAETVDTNLLTGYSIHSFKKGKESYRRQFYTLQVGPTAQPPGLNGSARAGEWPGPPIRLPLADSAAIDSPEERSSPSVVLTGVTSRRSLLLAAVVSGLRVNKKAVVRIVTNTGKVVFPSHRTTRAAGAGWIIQASFPLDSLRVKPQKDETGAIRLLVDSDNGPTTRTPLTVEIASSATGGAVFSTSLKSRSHNGIILFTPHPGLARLGESPVMW